MGSRRQATGADPTQRLLFREAKYENSPCERSSMLRIPVLVLRVVSYHSRKQDHMLNAARLLFGMNFEIQPGISCRCVWKADPPPALARTRWD